MRRDRDSAGDRYATEVVANYSALKANPSVFEGDLEKVFRDMILFSLAAYLEIRQRDSHLVQPVLRNFIFFHRASYITDDHDATGLTYG